MLHEMLRSELVPDSDEKKLVQKNFFLSQRDLNPALSFSCFPILIQNSRQSVNFNNVNIYLLFLSFYCLYLAATQKVGTLVF